MSEPVKPSAPGQAKVKPDIWDLEPLIQDTRQAMHILKMLHSELFDKLPEHKRSPEENANVDASYFALRQVDECIEAVLQCWTETIEAKARAKAAEAARH